MKTRIGAIFVLLTAATFAAHAQATRTWVSGVGDDVNPCSRTAPCKTFAGAISKTAAGGEIDALDPGGFGAVTITKSITLDGGGGQVASILASGFNAIIISWNAGNFQDPQGHIILRNLRINGGVSGLSGVSIINSPPADVVVENCDIYNFLAPSAASRGVRIATNGGNTKVTVANTSIRNISGQGIQSQPSGGGTVDLVVERVRMSGIQFTGIDLVNDTKAIIANSVISNNPAGAVAAHAASVTADIYDSVISRNNAGLLVGDTGAATVRLYGTQIVNNIFNGIVITAGTVGAANNNTIQGNGGTQATNLPLNTQ